tara:strand:+ start:233 stop:844 length:612 start_codon:yes stop_codon:yes gene_type:complete
MQWKSELIKTFDERISENPISPPLEVENIDEWRFKRISIEGVFLHDKELLMTGKTFEGTAGFHVITPIKTEEGRIIMINRGWIPETSRSQKKRPDTLYNGLLHIVGIIREDKKKGYFVPENEPKNEVWLYVNTRQMAMHRNIKQVANFYIDAIRKPGPYTLPIGASAKINVRNEHLQYAITWFLLALSLLIIYVIYHYPAKKE